MPEKQNINFNPELFNNVFWHIRAAFNNLLIRFIWIYGGSSASKTYSVVQAIVLDMLEDKDNNTLVLRKYATDIRDSIYSDFKTVIDEWGLNDLFIIQQNFIKCKTGSYVRFRGLDDSEKVKGISNFRRVILEEISQFDEVDLKQIRKRLRGKAGQQIIGIFNPISEEHWIKVNIFDKEVLSEIDLHAEAENSKVDFEDWKISGKWRNEAGDLVILKSNYTDNYWVVGKFRKGKQVGGFVDQHTINDFEKDKTNDYAYYLIYGLGNWGKLRTGGEFLKEFNPNLHVVSNPFVNGFPKLFRKDLPVHMFWDENVHPYLPCGLWQMEGKKAWQFDEIAMEDPKNRRVYACEEFKRRYHLHDIASLNIGGDRTAIKEDTGKEKGENFYTDIMNFLHEYRPRLKIASTNPNVAKSGDFVNACYRSNFEGIEITIGDNCKKSIHDYTYTLEDANGNIAKITKKNPVTGVSYQEFGHFTDIKRYAITTLFSKEYDKYKGGRNASLYSGGKNAAPNTW